MTKQHKRFLLCLWLLVFLVAFSACKKKEKPKPTEGLVVVDQTTAESKKETKEQSLQETEKPEAASETEPESSETEPEPSKEETTTVEQTPETEPLSVSVSEEEPVTLDPDGVYTSVEDVALYLHLYDTLPGNFITKKEAKALGWTGGGLDGYAYGMCIGGDYFGNYEGILPKADGREYHECDIDTLHQKSRGAKRIIYSNDGLIYYTEDHYETFTLLYGN